MLPRGSRNSSRRFGRRCLSFFATRFSQLGFRNAHRCRTILRRLLSPHTRGVGMSSSDSERVTQEKLGLPGDPFAMVIFGAGGDLTKRKLMPALYNLYQGKLLPDEFAIIGISIESYSDDEFRQYMTKDIAEYSEKSVDLSLWEEFVKHLYYLRGDFNDADLFAKLGETLVRLEKEAGTAGNVLFYLATAPSFFPVVVNHLGAAGLAKEENGRWKRVVIEKPFGHDLAFRFANGIIEPVWNRRYVDHVQVTVAEELGVEMRGSYYETAGALRDMVPNHIFQLITLTAMEPPISFDADSVHDEQTKVLRAIQILTPERVLDQAVRGQYDAGTINGKHVPAYRSEPNVSPESNTPTFVAMALHIDNWRWAGVPFYLRTGKRMQKRVTQVVIRFRRPPFMLFRNTSVDKIAPNELIINIQPNEGISLSFEAKIPGPVV